MEPDWKRYERGLLERLRYEFSEPHFKVCGTIAGSQHRVRGRFSLALRQLDAAVYRSGEGTTPFLIADAKHRATPLDVNDVEAFIGQMADVGATFGALAAPKGGSDAAKHRAAAADVEIRIISFDEALTFRWYAVALEVYPYDWIFHEQLARAVRALETDGSLKEVEAGLENIAFEEWERFVLYALQHHPEEGVSFLVWVARHHHDDGWIYNAARILEEVGLMPPELRAELLVRPDADLQELLADSDG
jgi:hypothetical protein